ncbi:MAG: hypothetical protein MZV70_28620 [Desulfobacterales bacterium]|nr:hypothetical protein [Desulfobacterales bacterium]
MRRVMRLLHQRAHRLRRDHAAPAATAASADITHLANSDGPRDPRGRPVHGLPGAHDLAQPALHRSATRSRRPSVLHQGLPRGEARAAGASSCSRSRASRMPPSAARRVPAPAVGRHAPAGHDRHGARLPARSCSSPTSRPPRST